MRKENISAEITERAFDFFYWFSRFEFSLKENGYLKYNNPGDRAEPGWDNFVQNHSDKYSLSQSATALIEQSPEQQIVLPGRELGWRPVKLDQHNSDLARVARLLKTVRNNLFHGGKHRGDCRLLSVREAGRPLASAELELRREHGEPIGRPWSP
ncbi:TPA: hypothetical protein ACRMKG_006543, partial [Pseudomonas aeruginosa]